MANFIFTVSEVNGYVKKVLEAEDLLQDISIRGEVSNYSKSISGHIYFTLKDEMASLQCVWFAGQNRANAINLTNGDKIKVRANVTLYIKGGTYQLIIRSVRKDGTGSLYEQFEELKRKLENEGLFDTSIKKLLPKYPRVVGVITSEHGAAIQDIQRVLDESWGNTVMLLYPVSVQGENAASQMIQALHYFDTNKAADVIIIGRGGGSFEDLNCFNDESLVRTVFNCMTPLISAVGHETDFTLCDFACDVREATPSTAAKRAVPDKNSELEKLYNLKHQLNKKVSINIQRFDDRLANINARYVKLDPNDRLMQTSQQLDLIAMRIANEITKKLESDSVRIYQNKKALIALNPKNTLNRGYAIIKDNSRKVLSDINMLKKSRKVTINMHDGSVHADILEENNE
ncbi:MAG: exodeoxyribonuclease VII large subunit [Clostridiales bacterium]|nr:exodeoxyribonuclease VII large subunit [Clostridiales bacterium]